LVRPVGIVHRRRKKFNRAAQAFVELLLPAARSAQGWQAKAAAVAHAVQRAESRVIATLLRSKQKEMSARLPTQHAWTRAPRAYCSGSAAAAIWAMSSSLGGGWLRGARCPAGRVASHRDFSSL